jgi:2,5-dioxopentanoate dehydrogenase
LVEEGSWVDARIDMAIPDRLPVPKADLRKMLEPIGPVAVFAASNFPFAYSTAGGDTAAALAAGCTVIMKGHSSHIKTSQLVTKAILKAVEDTNMPEGVFAMVLGPGAEVGKAIVEHPAIKAVGFTGSYSGGMALFHLANARKEPIPVFSEMGSINPVVLMANKLALEANAIAQLYAGSITQGVGQFCTNPGLIIGIEGADLNQFIEELAAEIEKIAPAPMLNKVIYNNYVNMRELAIKQQSIKIEAVSKCAVTGEIQGLPTIVSVSGSVFLQNKTLHQEVFGPYSLIVKCENLAQLTEIIENLEGQLTATLMATEAELLENKELINIVKNKCGRILFNGVPTGVEVGAAMQHGGPFPASTDSRFGAVGSDSIKRFVRPICYQSFPDSLLPDELKYNNPLNIWRLTDNNWSK